MNGYNLPTSAEIKGKTYAIRSDYRAILDVLGCLGESTSTEDAKQEALHAALTIFYPDYLDMPMYAIKEAIKYMSWFVNGGGDESQTPKKKPKLMDWTQDFPIIIAPINRVAGCEVRSVDYMHWWTFLAYYREIGDCLFAQVVSIRKKRMKGKKLDKSDKEFYEANRDLIDFKVEYTAAEDEILDQWIGGVADNAKE